MQIFTSNSCVTPRIHKMAPASTSSSTGATPPAIDLSDGELRAKCEEIFKKRPCDFQIKLYRAQRKGKNIISVARTGSGKTFTYLMPLIDSDDGIIIIVTALNILGEQFVQEAQAAGFSAISVNGANDTDDVFAVSSMNDVEKEKQFQLTANTFIIYRKSNTLSIGL
ncbi:hypothetical protein BC629DRAFT_1467385 [Irpex lacteus]|nr:hypothetical protein BC629DRAFT_1467385 [Irpex lacteus]